MMRQMRHSDAQEDPIEGFDTADLPPMGPDGLVMPADRAPTPPPPRLCEAGPCVNYHRFAIQLDVEGPKADSIEPGGKMSGTAPKQPFHVRVHHYCYPTVGVETELGALPVLECNRWRPQSYDDSRKAEQERETFLMSAKGQEYTAALDAWKAARAAEEASLEDDVATWITINMRDGGELVWMRLENGAINAEGRLDADSARAFVTRDYLKTNCGGPGLFDLVIVSPDGSSTKMQLEVT